MEQLYRSVASGIGVSCDSIQQFNIVRSLSRGSSGFVFKIETRKSQKPYALKVIYKGKGSDKGTATRVENEVAVHMSLKSRYVVQLENKIEDDDNVYLILEYCPDGDLAGLIKILGLTEGTKQTTNKRAQANNQPFPIEIHSLALQLAQGLTYLHQRNIVHGDLKPQNILLNKGELKICDFGLSTALKLPQMKSRGAKGTLNYLAPEILLSYDTKIDIWSYGCVLFELVMGQAPFRLNSLKDLSTAITEQSINSRLEEVRSRTGNKMLADLLKRTFQIDPQQRVTANQILLHPFFAKGSHGDISSKKNILHSNERHQTIKQASKVQPSLISVRKSVTSDQSKGHCYEAGKSSNQLICKVSSPKNIKNPFNQYPPQSYARKKTKSQVRLKPTQYGASKENICPNVAQVQVDAIRKDAPSNQRQKKNETSTALSPTAASRTNINSLHSTILTSTGNRHKLKPYSSRLEITGLKGISTTNKTHGSSQIKNTKITNQTNSQESYTHRPSPLRTNGMVTQSIKMGRVTIKVDRDGMTRTVQPDQDDSESSNGQGITINVTVDGRSITICKGSTTRNYDLSALPEKYFKYYEECKRTVQVFKDNTVRCQLVLSEVRTLKLMWSNRLKVSYDGTVLELASKQDLEEIQDEGNRRKIHEIWLMLQNIALIDSATN